MKQRKYLLILIGLLGMIQIHAQKSVAFKTDDESPLPQWIGAITDEDAHIPSNRDYVGTGTVNAKENQTGRLRLHCQDKASG